MLAVCKVEVVALVLTKNSFGYLSTLVEFLEKEIKRGKTRVKKLTREQQGSKPPRHWLCSYWDGYVVTDGETQNSGFFYVNAVEGKMKVFMTCKVALTTPYL